MTTWSRTSVAFSMKTLWNLGGRTRDQGPGDANWEDRTQSGKCAQNIWTQPYNIQRYLAPHVRAIFALVATMRRRNHRRNQRQRDEADMNEMMQAMQQLQAMQQKMADTQAAL